MIRHFQFEDELHASLACVPMPVRRKLDRVGLKVGLEQWRALSNGERLAICHLPADEVDECNAMTVFVREAVARRVGSEPKTLSEEQRAIAEPPTTPPSVLATRAKDNGFILDAEAWSKFDGDQRYALMKLGAGDKVSHNLKAALEEFFNG